MPKQLLSIPSFTAGELSSSMEGRTDFAKYFNGATNIENFVDSMKNLKLDKPKKIDYAVPLNNNCGIPNSD